MGDEWWEGEGDDWCEGEGDERSEGEGHAYMRFPYSFPLLLSRIVRHERSLTLFLVQKQVTICHSAMEACKDAEAIVIATEWKEFKEIDWQVVYDQMTKPAFVFDGRMILDAEKLKNIVFTVSVLRSTYG